MRNLHKFRRFKHSGYCINTGKTLYFTDNTQHNKYLCRLSETALGCLVAKSTKKLVSCNTWRAKFLRFFTAFGSIDKSRKGSCRRCGACCKLPNVCPFLGFDENGLAVCRIYALRPLSCRKYPRTEAEHLTKQSCGFSFEQ